MNAGMNARNRCTLLCLFVLLLTAGAACQVKPQEVTFPSGKLQLHGFLWKPDGPGPFPAILWNHGSEKLPGWRPELGAFYTAHNYVLFIPHRRGQGRSPGEYIEDLRAKAPPSQRNRRLVDLQEEAVEDVVAALNYLKAQPFVDRERMAMSGCSYGGIQTLLAGERDLGVKALVPFAPAAMSWEENPELQDRLKRAVDHAQAPVFLLQAQNDFSLAPSHELAKEAKKKNIDFQAKIFPPFGSSHQDGHGGFCATATAVWGDDVLSFLEAHWTRK
jgi:dienelactone hydrolase